MDRPQFLFSFGVGAQEGAQDDFQVRLLTLVKGGVVDQEEHRFVGHLVHGTFGLGGIVQKSVKSRLGHRLRRQQESWEMTQQEDQRKYEQKEQKHHQGLDKEIQVRPSNGDGGKGEISKSALPWKPRGEFRRD